MREGYNIAQANQLFNMGKQNFSTLYVLLHHKATDWTMKPCFLQRSLNNIVQFGKASKESSVQAVIQSSPHLWPTRPHSSSSISLPPYATWTLELQQRQSWKVSSKPKKKSRCHIDVHTQYTSANHLPSQMKTNSTIFINCSLTTFKHWQASSQLWFSKSRKDYYSTFIF